MKSSIPGLKLGFAIMATGLSTVATPALAKVTKTDPVLITLDGYALAGPGSSQGEPTVPGELTWDQTAQGVIPRLFANLHFYDQSGNCARVRMKSYDENDLELGVDDSDEECAFQDGHVRRQVEISGELGASRVEVLLQTEAGGAFGNPPGNDLTISYGELLRVDKAWIASPEYNFGAGVLVDGIPQENATVTWAVENGDEVKPVLQGVIGAIEADDSCVRIDAEYRDRADIVVGQPGPVAGRALPPLPLFTVLEWRPGQAHCPISDEAERFPVLKDEFSDTAVDEVVYTLMKQSNGIWAPVASTTVRL